MTKRTCAWLLVLPLLVGSAGFADTFWYTTPQVGPTPGDVRWFKYDPVTAWVPSRRRTSRDARPRSTRPTRQ